MKNMNYEQQEQARATARRIAESRKLDELKLGKFAKCEPLHLPEKKLERRWEMLGGIGLILIAIAGAVLTFLIKPVRNLTWDQNGFGAFEGLPVYWLVMVGCLIVCSLGCLIAGILLLAKKRVPAVLWYLIIILLTVGALCASFRTFQWYEARKCYENYPGIYPKENRGSGCPSVENSLILLTLRNLALYTVGLLLLAWAYRVSKRRVKCTRKSKKR